MSGGAAWRPGMPVVDDMGDKYGGRTAVKYDSLMTILYSHIG